MATGGIFAGHVCYLMTGERTLDAVDAPSSLVCILGVEHRSPKNFTRHLDPLALQLSEAYEYALRCGNTDAICPTIQPFKLAHAEPGGRVHCGDGTAELTSVIPIKAFRSLSLNVLAWGRWICMT